MGFFSKVRRRIKKLIPKEVRPYVPYIAAAIPGMGPFASTALKGYGAAANSFLTASAAKGLTDDEADLKDIFRTGALAAAPQAIGQGLGQFGEKFGNAPMEGMGNRGILETLGNAASRGSESKYLNPDFSQSGNFGNTAKIVGAQGTADVAIKAAELNEDALADYNRQMLESGVNDKAGRRAAIRQIYANTGTWDMGEVDSMLDTYGYRTGGRVNYEEGGSVKYKHFQDMLETAKEGLASLEDDGEVMPIRELRLKEGGSVDDKLMERVKELQDEGLDFASAMAQAMKEDMASGKAMGGIMDVNENINMNIPGVGNENIDVNSMESIRGQTAGPQWYYDRIQALEFEFGDELTDEEIAEIAYDSDKFYDKMGYDPAEYKKGGRVNRAEGGMMMASADMDIPIQDLAEDFEITFGRPAESIEELKDYYRKKYEFNGDTSSSENNGIGKMADMDYREFIYDASRDNFANDMFGKDYMDLTPEETEEVDIIIEMELGKKQVAPERMMAAEGGLMNLGGREMDLRGGGFVPMGKAERADDVPARLSKNEFVMTADAVRAAGGGSVQKGADLMYDQMKQLERQA